MVKKKIFLLGTMLLMLAGCGKEVPAAEPEKETAAEEAAAQVSEVPAEEAGIEENKENMSEESGMQEEITSKTEPPTGEVLYYDRKGKLGFNNGIITEWNDRVYFHVPDADAMMNTCVLGEYMYNDCGLTVLLSCDTDGGDLRTEAYDHAVGVMGALGNGLAYMAPLWGENQVMRMDLFTDGKAPEESIEQTADRIYEFFGTTKDGTYAVGMDYDAAYNVLRVVNKEHEAMEYTLQGYLDFAGLAGDAFFYIAGEFGKNMSYSLRSIDLASGEIVDYGALPGREISSYCGGADEFAEDGRNVYMTYSFYEGTGYFFAGGYYVKAVIGEENSLTSEEMPAQDMEEVIDPSWVPFYVDGGKMYPAEGIPGSCKVLYEGGTVGYYDETGHFVPVADGYYVYEDERMENAEGCVKIGDAIYLIHNVNVHAPEDDIGWRYAYYRETSDVLRIAIDTGEETLIHHAAGPKGE